MFGEVEAVKRRVVVMLLERGLDVLEHLEAVPAALAELMDKSKETLKYIEDIAE